MDDFDAPPPSPPPVSTPAVPGVAVFTAGEWIPIRRPTFTELMAQLAEPNDD